MIAPPLPVTGPLRITDAPLETTSIRPPVSTPVVTFPSASSEIAPLPANSPALVPTVALPCAAERRIAPSLVAIAALTLTSRLAASVAVPPATPSRPSIWAFTLMSPPAVALSGAPVLRLSTA